MMKKIILASGSPRRKMLLKQIGLRFEIDVSNYQEKTDRKLTPVNLVKYISKEKAQLVAKKYRDAIIITADTILTINGKIIGKPRDSKDAKNILGQLSNKSHMIITGFTIIDTATSKSVTKSVGTTIWFKKLSTAEIDDYVSSGEPLDKAGAYGIQEKGGVFVKKIVGDYFNVVGLPIYSLAEELKKFGIYL